MSGVHCLSLSDCLPPSDPGRCPITDSRGALP